MDFSPFLTTSRWIDSSSAIGKSLSNRLILSKILYLLYVFMFASFPLP